MWRIEGEWIYRVKSGLEKMQISWEEVYISNKFPTMSYVFLYMKSHNFPGRSFPDSTLFPTVQVVAIQTLDSVCTYYYVGLLLLLP